MHWWKGYRNQKCIDDYDPGPQLHRSNHIRFPNYIDDAKHWQMSIWIGSQKKYPTNHHNTMFSPQFMNMWALGLVGGSFLQDQPKWKTSTPLNTNLELWGVPTKVASLCHVYRFRDLGIERNPDEGVVLATAKFKPFVKTLGSRDNGASAHLQATTVTTIGLWTWSAPPNISRLFQNWQICPFLPDSCEKTTGKGMVFVLVSVNHVPTV